MKFFSSFLSYFLNFKKNFLSKKIILISSLCLLFLLIIFFLFKSIYGSWWVFWPQKIKSEIALNRLAVSIYNDPYCRMDCFLERSLYQKEILNSLNRESFSKKIEKIILNEDENLDFRLELLKIIYLDESFDFQNIEAYLNNNEANLKLKNYIVLNSVKNEASSMDDYYQELQNSLIGGSLSLDDKILALNSLSFSNLDLVDFYIALLKVESEPFLINEILRLLASDKKLLLLDKDFLFEELLKIILEKKYSFSSSRLVIFIFSEFLDKDLLEADFISSLIDSGDLDKFNRYLLIELWNQYFEEKKELPKIEQDEWDWYYQQN